MSEHNVLAEYSAACPACDTFIAKGRSRISLLPVPLNGRSWCHLRCYDRALRLLADPLDGCRPLSEPMTIDEFAYASWHINWHGWAVVGPLLWWDSKTLPGLCPYCGDLSLVPNWHKEHGSLIGYCDNQSCEARNVVISPIGGRGSGAWRVTDAGYCGLPELVVERDAPSKLKRKVVA